MRKKLKKGIVSCLILNLFAAEIPGGMPKEFTYVYASDFQDDDSEDFIQEEYAWSEQISNSEQISEMLITEEAEIEESATEESITEESAPEEVSEFETETVFNGEIADTFEFGSASEETILPDVSEEEMFDGDFLDDIFSPEDAIDLAAAEGRLITVGGKNVTSDMKIADLKKMFGEPKLTTGSMWGGNAYTFYGDNYSNFLYIETSADGSIAGYGSVSKDFVTNEFSYGDKPDNYVRVGYEATDNTGKLFGIMRYRKYDSEIYRKYCSNLEENNRNMCKHAVEMWNAVSFLYGKKDYTYFDERMFALNEQFAECHTTLLDYCSSQEKNYLKGISAGVISFPQYFYPNPLQFAKSARGYICPEGYAAGFCYYARDEKMSEFGRQSGFISPEILSKWELMEYTEEEKVLLKNAKSYYAKSLNEYNSSETYYETEPYYGKLSDIRGGKLSDGIAKGAVDYLNAIRVGCGLPPLKYSEELSIGAQNKATYTRYLSSIGYYYNDPHYPPQLNGLSDDYYAKAQMGSGENMFMCGLWSTDVIGSISNALSDAAGIGQHYSRGHRYNLLDPNWEYIGVGSTDSQGCHKTSGYRKSDVDIVAWPGKGIMLSESQFNPTDMWTCWFRNGMRAGGDTSIMIHCLNSGKIWTIDPKNLKQNQDYSGKGDLISFADNSIAFQREGFYEITFFHLLDANGNDVSYSYRTIYTSAYEGSGNEPVTSVKLDKNSLSLVKGETQKLTVMIAPVTAGNKRVFWSSSNPDVVNVNACGTVSAVAEGSATITVRSESGGFSASCNITVTKQKTPVLEFALTNVTKTYGDAPFTNKLSKTTDGKLTYQSSNTNVAIVNSEGLVTIKGVGKTTITVTAEATLTYKAGSATYELLVDSKAPSLKFVSANVTKTYGDAAFTNKLIKTTDGKLTYQSSNTDVAMINSEGLVTIKGVGKSTITVTAEATLTYKAASTTYELLVNSKTPSLKFASTSVTKKYGDVAFMNKLSKTTDGKITYKSSDIKVATINSKGLVTIKGAGKTTITVKSAATAKYKAGSKTYNLVVKPGKAKIKSVINPSSGKVTLKWKSSIGVGATTANSKYYIQYSTDKKFTKVVKVSVKGTAGSKSFTGLKKGKTYYFRIRAYDTVTKKYGVYSEVKKIKLLK